jgi:hypothetical protein
MLQAPISACQAAAGLFNGLGLWLVRGAALLSVKAS